MAEPTTSKMSALDIAQSDLEDLHLPPSSDQSNDAADGLPVLAHAGHDEKSVDNVAPPSIGLPVSQLSSLPTEGDHDHCWFVLALPLTVRERVMMAVMAALKDKQDWEREVFDELIVNRWRAEALTTHNTMEIPEQTSEAATAGDEQTQQSEAEDPSFDYNAPARQRVVTERMFQCCIDELREQAADALSNKFAQVMEANATAYISDECVSLETKLALRSAAAPLEDVPDDQKDWHSGSQGKVLDLVHPSLFPLMYGKSKYLPTGSVPLQECAGCTGQGNTVHFTSQSIHPVDCSHQWLPCEVLIGTSSEAKIVSYINNLHPDGNGALYAAIEQVISSAIPLWKEAVRSTLYRYERPRLIVEGDGYDHDAAYAVGEQMKTRRQERRKAQEEERASDTEIGNAREAAQRTETGDDANDEDDSDDVNDSESDDDDIEDPYNSKYTRVPEPGPYESRVRIATDKDAASFEKTFAGNNLQVIVKLANIHLTPEKPTYDGGSWHIEVLPSEHICASALYYYDSSNVTESFLAFRESVNHYFLSMNKYSNFDFPFGPEYEQGHHDALVEIYGLLDDSSGILPGVPTFQFPAVQVLGKVSTREGRLLVFPNVLQHRVLPFKLADATKPGHYKVLALYLVDPNIKIPSTANVPPQQRQQWARKIDEIGALSKLPPELKDLVYNELDFPLSTEQAKQVRADFMEEREAHVEASVFTWQTECYEFYEG